MLVYNVTIKIDREISPEWNRWMTDIHIPAILETGLVERYNFCKLRPIEGDDEGETYVAQYFFREERDYENYLEAHAPALREDGINRFPNRFVAFRTIMDHLSGGA